MTILPIVERELRVASRRTGLNRNRFLVPAGLLLFLFVEYLFAPGSILPTNIGSIVYLIVTYLAFAICALEGVRHTADCISEEKREGTLGLLFLTDLNGYDVVFGKLAAVSLASAQALLAMVPILGCVLFLGGVTAGEIARAAIALVSLMYFSLSLGLWVSSRSRIASHAMGATLLLLVLVLVAPMLVPLEAIQVLSPARAFFGSADALYSKHAWGFWISLVFTQVFMANFLMRAAANTNFFREGEPMKAGAEIKAVEPRFSSDWKARARTLDVSPVAWLAFWKSGSSILPWVLVGLTVPGVICFEMSPGPGRFTIVFCSLLAVHLILKIILAAVAPRCIAEARRNNILELLLCTPVTAKEILDGQVAALKRKFLKPFLIIIALEITVLDWWLTRLAGTNRGPAGDNYITVAALDAVICIFLLLDIQCVAWTGIWFGLCSKSESVAAFKTAFYIIIVPLLFLAIYCVGVVVFVGWPLMAYYWARIQLQEHFRALSGMRSIASGNLTHWLPFNVPGLPEEPWTEEIEN